METCIWCDAAFSNRVELEYHVEQEHEFVVRNVKIKV